MTHIKNIIKKNSINSWKECFICEHMIRPDRITIYPNLDGSDRDICDECN